MNRSSNVIESLEELNKLNNELPEGTAQESEAFADSIEILHLKYRAIRAFYASERYFNVL